jgi:hypothetical protein
MNDTIFVSIPLMDLLEIHGIEMSHSLRNRITVSYAVKRGIWIPRKRKFFFESLYINICFYSLV